jgi:hypothetical protein
MHQRDVALASNLSVTDEMQDKQPDNCDELRDPEDRPITNERELREKMLDKTLADSFPTSDPPSTIPDPAGEDSLRLNENDIEEKDSAETTEKASRESQNRNKINLSDDEEVRHWTESLGVSREHLEELVHKHGDSAEKIREKLKKEAA